MQRGFWSDRRRDVDNLPILQGNSQRARQKLTCYERGRGACPWDGDIVACSCLKVVLAIMCGLGSAEASLLTPRPPMSRFQIISSEGSKWLASQSAMHISFHYCESRQNNCRLQKYTATLAGEKAECIDFAWWQQAAPSQQELLLSAVWKQCSPQQLLQWPDHCQQPMPGLSLVYHVQHLVQFLFCPSFSQSCCTLCSRLAQQRASPRITSNGLQCVQSSSPDEHLETAWRLEASINVSNRASVCRRDIHMQHAYDTI